MFSVLTKGKELLGWDLGPITGILWKQQFPGHLSLFIQGATPASFPCACSVQCLSWWHQAQRQRWHWERNQALHGFPQETEMNLSVWFSSYTKATGEREFQQHKSCTCQNKRLKWQVLQELPYFIFSSFKRLKHEKGCFFFRTGGNGVHRGQVMFLPSMYPHQPLFIMCNSKIISV